jgi:hypothetical protein
MPSSPGLGPRGGTMSKNFGGNGSRARKTIVRRRGVVAPDSLFAATCADASPSRNATTAATASATATSVDHNKQPSHDRLPEIGRERAIARAGTRPYTRPQCDAKTANRSQRTVGGGP